MKESRFIELLNLYVDQELSPVEAQELETEIASHPARRSRYEQYCRMQRGCSLLFESTRAQAPRHPKLIRAGEAAEAKVLSFPSPATPVPANPFGRRMAWGGSLAAAAACVGVILLQRPVTETASPMAAAVTPAAIVAAPASTVEEAAEATQPARLPMRRQQVRPSDYQLATLFSNSAQSAEDVFGDFDAPGIEWMRQVEYSMRPHLPVDSLRFRTDRNEFHAPATIHSQPASLRTSDEFNAFEFRR